MHTISATQWIFGHEEIETTLIRLEKYGYQGIELSGDAINFSNQEISNLLNRFNLGCTSICGMYTKERNLSSIDSTIRLQGVSYVKQCIDLAARAGATVVIVVPSPVGMLESDGEGVAVWNAAVQSLTECGEYAEKFDITLAIEALNRYETYLVNNMSTAYALMKQVNHPRVKLMADVFHMNIEERDLSQTLVQYAQHIVHVHLADNTREAPGQGSIPFQKLLDTLSRINYRGAYTMEFMASSANPYDNAAEKVEARTLDINAERAIEYIRSLGLT